MDILGADDMKWTMRIIAKFAQKKLENEMKARYDIRVPAGKSFIDFIHDDLRLSANPAIKKIYKKLLQAGEAMPTQHHASMIVDLGSFLLWVAFKDTAYRDPLFWITNELLSDPALKDDIKPFVKEPKDWYCPQWRLSIADTDKLKVEGKIPEHGMSPAEQRFVPAMQIQQIDAELQKQLRRERMKNV